MGVLYNFLFFALGLQLIRLFISNVVLNFFFKEDSSKPRNKIREILYSILVFIKCYPVFLFNKELYVNIISLFRTSYLDSKKKTFTLLVDNNNNYQTRVNIKLNVLKRKLETKAEEVGTRIRKLESCSLVNLTPEIECKVQDIFKGLQSVEQDLLNQVSIIDSELIEINKKTEQYNHQLQQAQLLEEILLSADCINECYLLLENCNREFIALKQSINSNIQSIESSSSDIDSKNKALLELYNLN